MTNITQQKETNEQRLVEIEHTIKKLGEQIETLSTDVEDLVAAWKAANWLVNLVKWAAAVSSAISVLYLMASGKGFK